ncbi:Fur family transcriptional regulator [Marinoscillum furvescens]|uniref:Fur family peroxide stress response transcriptional regulator n=1 Tax=Marinoscillum furvescens DSM 4134 TaxID=1122208 RepID=A0A3D9LGY2_MARFU|nr:transcriptional repressor [Marinoscillum furvescens]REE05734.1 Fur family peroxide stress response transcriptional regulator [Marinoscillum furvescens DSM 4134]
MTEKTYQHIKELLSEAGLKATHPRIAVLHELMLSDEHPSAEQLHDRVSRQYPSVSLGSVYRVLEKLVEADLVYQVATRGGSKRYDANLEQHCHIYSINTEEIQDYYDPELNELIKNYFHEKQVSNFKITDIKLQINGEKRDPKSKVTIV